MTWLQERMGNECLGFSASTTGSDLYQQEEGAEERLLDEQPRVSVTQTKEAEENRGQVL